jgi:Holliday junction DNA helicase RuvA
VQAEELAGALARGDLARLSAIPGIGKKTAERLVVELREKVKKLGLELSTQAATPGRARDSGLLDDVASALINLGYKEALVTKVLAELAPPDDMPMEDALKQALKRLMR